MANDRALGGGILIGSIVGIIVYGILLYYWAILILEITAFLGVVVLLGILGWIGWTMATTPPPEPMPEMAGTGTQTPPPSPSPSPPSSSPPATSATGPSAAVGSEKKTTS